MAKKLNSKKSNKSKIIVASILAAVILVAALVSVVMVLAAGIQNVQSYVNVSYTVEDVAAKVLWVKISMIPPSIGSITRGAGLTVNV